jgi:hypothetical protein
MDSWEELEAQGVAAGSWKISFTLEEMEAQGVHLSIDICMILMSYWCDTYLYDTQELIL